MGFNHYALVTLYLFSLESVFWILTRLSKIPTQKQLRMRIIAHLFLLAGLIGSVMSPPACAEAPQVSIQYREQVSAFFAEADVHLHMDIATTHEVAGTAMWTLLAHGRVLASGEVDARLTPDKPAVLSIERRLPTLNAGAAFPLQLKVAFRSSDDKKPLCEIVQELWLLSDNPFVDRQKWLQALELQLFDPIGDTATAFQKLDVPFKQLHNADGLSELSQGTVIIGEGASLKDYPSLSKTLPALTMRGVNVICLAAGDGELLLPVQASDDNRAADQFSLRRIDVVGQLDKRLRSSRWVPDEQTERSELILTAADTQIRGEIVEAGKGWPWLEVHYSQPSARFVYCGFGLIKAWDQSPVPRYLLASLLEALPQEAAQRMESAD